MKPRIEDTPPSFGHLTEDDIIDASHGLTDDAERIAFGRHADDCADCRARLREAIADRQRAALRRRPGRRPISWRLPATAAAAVLVLGVALGWGLAIAPEPSGDYVLPPARIETSKRSLAAEAGADRLRDGIEAYVRGDLAESIAILEPLELSEGADGLRRIYLASALARRGDRARSRALLVPKAIGSYPREWRDRAAWIVYPLLRDDDPETARRLLVELSEPGGEFTERASRELRSQH